MRIGEFARKHNVTIDSVRHYIDLELILPEKDGAHFHFDEKCSRDIEEVKWLKSHKFTLSEIQKLFVIRRLTKLKTGEDRKYYRDIFIEKKNRLLIEHEQIGRLISEIDDKAQLLCREKEKAECRLGVPLAFLNTFVCPECKGSIRLNKAQIENDMIIDGNLDCRCGFTAEIDNGIIVFNSAMEGNSKMELADSLEQYIETTAPEYINFMYRAVEWMAKRIDFNPEQSGIILEPGVGDGFFIKQINGLLPQNMLYIPVDHDLEKLRTLKSYLEAYSKHGGYVFICCDLNDIPVKDNAVDLVVDFFGSTNYNFRKSDFLLKLLESKVRHEGKWLGLHFCLDRHSRTVIKYPAECRPYFYKDTLLAEYKQSNFFMLESAELGHINRAGESEPFFIEGDNLYFFAYHGCKTSG